MRTRFTTNTPERSSQDKARLLELLYPVADPLASHEEHERFTHADLDGLTRAELGLERARVVWRLTHDDTPDRWLLNRLDAIDDRLTDVA